MPALAALPARRRTRPCRSARRVLNANFRLGGAEHAAALAEVAAGRTCPRRRGPWPWRCWPIGPSPSGRDKVMGLWRPIPPRPARPAADALRPKLAAISRVAPSETSGTRPCSAAVGLGIKEAGADLAALAADRDQSDRTRAAALKALDELEDPRRVDAAQRGAALARISQPDRGAARARQGRSRRGDRTGSRSARPRLAGRAARGDRRPGRHAWRCPAGQTLSRWLDRLIAGQVPPEHPARPDRGRRPPDASRRAPRQAPAVRERPSPRATRWPPYREVLAGGDAQRGMSIFTTKAEVECLRCHKVKGPTGEITGGEVGPELSGIGVRQNRTYLLESIVDPNKQIAQGLRVGRPGHQRRQGRHRRLPRRGRQGRPAHHRRRKTRRRTQGRDRGAQARPLGHARRPGSRSYPRPSCAT